MCKHGGFSHQNFVPRIRGQEFDAILEKVGEPRPLLFSPCFERLNHRRMNYIDEGMVIFDPARISIHRHPPLVL